jgi:hypothetical protein
MSSVIGVACSSTNVYFKPAASMAVRGEKLGWDPWFGQSVCLGF